MPKKKGKKKKKKSPSTTLCVTSGTAVAAPLDWKAAAQRERDEITAMENTIRQRTGSLWCRFKLSEATWIPFGSDPSIDAAFDDSYLGGTEEVVMRWMERAESAVKVCVVKELILHEERARAFRSLGRGWIFIHLDRPKRRFRWWFESVDRVLANHQSEIVQLALDEEQIDKYTRGYMCTSELVIMMKGLTVTSGKQARMPLIFIEKMCPAFGSIDGWGTSAEEKAALHSPLPTDEDRRQHAKKAKRRARRKVRQKEKRAESRAALALTDADSVDGGSGGGAPVKLIGYSPSPLASRRVEEGAAAATWSRWPGPAPSQSAVSQSVP